MTKPQYNKKYETGPLAPYVDWIAGGNFDGYVVKKSLTFLEDSEVVELVIDVIDQSRFDGYVNQKKISGTYEFSDKDTITLSIPPEKYRGKILGQDRALIVFSILSEKTQRTEVYELKK